MKILLVTGMPGAGKEELLNVARSMDIPFLRMGDIVREFHAKRSEEDKDLSVGQLANLDRQRYGFDIWAKRAVEKMYGDIFMIDGCRSMDEVRAYRNITDDVNIVGIFASPATRYDRLVKRGRDDAPKNLEEFKERDDRELGWGLGETMALADRMIINESSLEEFKANVKRLMEDFRR